MAVQSFPLFHVTGPIHHYIRPAQSSTIYYVGTAEVSPQTAIQRMSKDVFNSIGGRMVPMQRLDHGEIVTVASLLNRFSKSAITAIKTAGVAGFNGHVIADGWRSRWSRGSLKFGLTTVELWMVYENYQNVAFRTIGLEPGRYYPVFDLEQLGTPEADTVDEKALLVGTAFPLWTGQQSATSVADGDRTWKLYSINITDFPNDVLVPQ